MISPSTDTNTVAGRGVYLSQGLLFAVAFGFFYFVGNYVLVFQETQSLFVFSGDSLRLAFSRPGGPLAYAADFLTQFYSGRLSGALLISVVLTLPGTILYAIIRRMAPDTSVSWILPLIPSCLLFAMQADHYHRMEYNLGFLLILCYYLFSILSDRRTHRILVMMLLPLFYYLTGAYALVFSGMFVVHALWGEKGKQRYVDIPLLLTIAAVSFLIFWKLIFFQTARQILLFPLPVLADLGYNTALFVLAACVVFCPVMGRVATRLSNSRWKGSPYTFAASLIVFPSFIFLMYLEYDPQAAGVIELERLVYEGKWDEAIELQENKPSRTLLGQYFYNIALSETDQLSDRLFFGGQDFGPSSLVLPWSLEHLNSGAYFYYAVGLTNEAHRWAYEEMVVYGYRPENIKILAKTSLLNGDSRMARMYVDILKRTVHYRDWATDYEMMVDNPDLISAHPELGAKSDVLPSSNFFVAYNEPRNVLSRLIEAQPDNPKVLDYFLAELLLTKNVEAAVNSIQHLKEAGYTQIPRHLEEAALIYADRTNALPELGGLTIRPETRARFDNYFASYADARRDLSTMKQTMQARFGNTFWFYLQFN